MPKIHCLSPKIENYSPKSDTNAQDGTQNLDNSLSKLRYQCLKSDICVTFAQNGHWCPKLDTCAQNGTLVSKSGHWSLKLDTSVQILKFD